MDRFSEKCQHPDIERTAPKTSESSGHTFPGRKYGFFEKQASGGPLHVSYFTILLSFTFWAIVLMGVVYLISNARYASYLSTYDMTLPCKKQIQTTLSLNDNQHVIEKFPFGENVIWLKYLLKGHNTRLSGYALNDNKMFPIVTAVTPKDIYRVQSLIQQVYEELVPEHGPVNFVLYTIGLDEDTLHVFQRDCQCEVEIFDTIDYPEHMKHFYTNAWKPIIIQTVLNKYGAALWIDPSTKFTNIVELVKSKTLHKANITIWKHPELAEVTGFTHPDMFTFFQEERCEFANHKLVNMNAFAIKDNNFTRNVIMKNWLACALSVDCISPPGAVDGRCFSKRTPQFTGCHKFDQSALSIVLNRANLMSSSLPFTMLQSTTDDVQIFRFPAYYDNYFSIPKAVILICAIIFAVLFFCKRSRRTSMRKLFQA